ncbi:MAG: hypothetical protein OEX02_11295 [Cyclobacteriaceae bacterium]|nr:hypothetical protein [Cyclobacteriaceae bacterium]
MRLYYQGHALAISMICCGRRWHGLHAEKGFDLVFEGSTLTFKTDNTNEALS